MMQAWNNLRISIRLMIIFGAVAVIAFTGIIQNNRKSQQFKSELNNTYEFKLQNWKHIDEAEKNMHHTLKSPEPSITFHSKKKKYLKIFPTPLKI